MLQTSVVHKGGVLDRRLSLDRVADGQLGGLVYDNSVVQVIVLEPVIVIVYIHTHTHTHRLGGAKLQLQLLGLRLLGLRLLGLRELDGIVLQLLEGRDVEVVEAVIGEVVHLSIDDSPGGGGGAFAWAWEWRRVVSRPTEGSTPRFTRHPCSATAAAGVPPRRPRLPSGPCHWVGGVVLVYIVRDLRVG
jgi:hypothetical protein